MFYAGGYLDQKILNDYTHYKKTGVVTSPYYLCSGNIYAAPRAHQPQKTCFDPRRRIESTTNERTTPGNFESVQTLIAAWGVKGGGVYSDVESTTIGGFPYYSTGARSVIFRFVLWCVPAIPYHQLHIPRGAGTNRLGRQDLSHLPMTIREQKRNCVLRAARFRITDNLTATIGARR
ncbi:MAG: hypothetical protein CM15mP103_12410 [Gammaproteobacteria bacterium]|nr:MAG: hypothetical protein CM15mP103_12410 [Gammaproteobacteria bacterium]